MKKWLGFIALILMVGFISACSGGGEGSAKDGDTITLFSTISDENVKSEMEAIIDDFESENQGIKVETNFPGGEYENLLKVKMAANDMPDVFDTHGWAQIRYGDYLADLSEEDWASEMSGTIEPVLTDDQGKVYALPLNEAKEGISYNEEVLEEYGVEVPKTFDELMAASKKIHEGSNGEVTPFFFAGADPWTLGQYFDYFATPLLISDEQHDYGEELLNGEFDWSRWTFLPEKFKEMYEKGYINKDVLTAKYSDGPRLFAENKIAFAMYPPSFVTEAKKINENVEAGLMPIPAIHEGDEPTFVGGERYTLGVWKDSPKKEAAKKLLAHFAKPENAKRMAEASGLPAGLEGVQAESMYQEYYQKYSDVRVYPYFDRVYLPNGMWDVMTTLGQEVLSGAITPEQYSERMSEEVERLRSQN
ncbi:extracellular solute-binding protein [Halobacillus yeomjeoni]|uniref:ABC transporter substrate-binding protein n=1 Tax=Halobacillus yeomjeoni TaxID=311194 RepID=UPI001CD79B6B|nr:extracellular solute-binding protein [Halobacillus yeomjeoni]MCA0985261.1 extracellular solute-binding protein [Halobacillus yeomjeoni]